MIGMLNIVSPNLEPSFGEFYRILHFRGTADWTAPNCAYRSTHFNAGITGLFNAPFSLTPVLSQRHAGIGKMMLRIGGNHHQNSIGAITIFFHLNCPIHCGFPDGHTG